MTTKNITTEVFAAALQEITIAVDAYCATNPHDGGTSNFDAVTLAPEGERLASLIKRLTAAGFGGLYESSRYGRKCVFLNFGENRYQGGCRTKIVELAARILKLHNIPASLYYQMD